MGKHCADCDYVPPKPPPPPKPRVNNVRSQNSAFCCGMSELGNFNYVDPPGGKKMTHYHKVGGGWSVQQNQDPTTEADVRQAMEVPAAGFIATTGAGQEYMDPILEKIGFQHVSTFRNPGHADTPVKLWVFCRHKVKK